MDHEELVYRLAKAQEAEEIKKADNRKTWKEIAKEIGWKFGSGIPSVKLLANARKRLEQYKDNDPEGILDEVNNYRGKKKKET